MGDYLLSFESTHQESAPLTRIFNSLQTFARGKVTVFISFSYRILVFDNELERNLWFKNARTRPGYFTVKANTILRSNYYRRLPVKLSDEYTTSVITDYFIGHLKEFMKKACLQRVLLWQTFVVVVVVVVVFTLKAVPVSTQYFLTSVLVQLTRTPSVVTG